MKTERFKKRLPLLAGLLLCLTLLLTWGITSAFAEIAWPHLTSLAPSSVSGKAVLTPSNAEPSVPITAVEYENYTTVEPEVLDELNINYKVGKITLHIAEPLGMTTYELKSDALNAAFSELPENYYSYGLHIKSEGAKTAAAWAGSVQSNIFAFFDDGVTAYLNYYYELTVVVDTAEPEEPTWPHLTSLALSSNPEKAVLVRQAGGTVPITSVSFENDTKTELSYVDPDWGDKYYTVGEITLHIDQPLGSGDLYHLKVDALTAGFSALPVGFTQVSNSISTNNSDWANPVPSGAYASTYDEAADIYTFYCYNVKVVVDTLENAAPNRLSAVSATATADVTAGTAYTLDLSTIFEDADGDTLTYKVQVNGAAAVTADEDYSYTPAAAGTTTLVFTANDGTADSTDTYTVTLTAEEEEPEEPTWPHLTSLALSSNPEKAVLVRQAGGTVPITSVSFENDTKTELSYVDPDWGDKYYTVGEITLHIDQPLGSGDLYHLKVDALTAGFSALPVGFTQVSNSISTNNSDWANPVPSGAYASTYDEAADIYTFYCYNVKVVVDTPENVAPNRLSAVNATATADVTAGTAYTLDLSTIFEDADGDTLTYKVQVNGAAAVAADEDYSYTPAAVGTTTLVFTANDGTADSTDTYTVTLTATGEEPEGPAWPHLTSLALSGVSGKAVLTPSNADPSVPITAVAYENYTTVEPEVLDELNINYKVGKITLHIAEPLGMTTYELKSDALNAAFSELPENHYSYGLHINSEGAKTAAAWAGSVQSNIFAFFDDGVTAYLNYYYDLAVVVDAPAVNHAPKLKAGVTTPATASVQVGKAYTLDLLTIFEDEDVGDTLTYKGKLNDEMPAMLSSNYYGIHPSVVGGTYTLVFTASDGKADSPEYTVNLTATSGTEGPAWPQLTSLALSSVPGKAVLVKEGGAVKIPITEVEYENYDELVIADQTAWSTDYIAGEITLQVAEPLGITPYKLNGDALAAVCSDFPAGNDKGWSVSSIIYTDGYSDWSGGTVRSRAYADSWTLIDERSDFYFYNIKIVVDPAYVDTAPPALTAGTVARTSQTTATVKFTSNEAGMYYYEVADAEAAAPTVDTSGAGTAMTAGENTIALSGLASGAKKIYVKAKDNAETPNVTASALVIDIPAYTAQSRELWFEYFTPIYEIRSVTADGVPVTLVYTDPGYSAAKAKGNIPEGAAVTVTIMPAQVKDIDTVSYKLEGYPTNSKPENSAVTGPFSFSFTMPATKTTVNAINFKEPVVPRYAINTAVSHYNPSYNSPMGTVGVTVGGTAFNQAEPGAAVVATAAPLAHAAYTFRFVRWEAAGLTLSESERINPTLSFSMPAEAVTLTAVFEKFGSSITFSANNYAIGDILMVVNNRSIIGNATYDAAYPHPHKYDTVTDTVSAGAILSFRVYMGTYNFGYRIVGWEIMNTTTGMPVSDVTYYDEIYSGNEADGYGTYQAPLLTVDGISSYTVRALVEAKAFGKVTAAVNDSAMGTATVSIGDTDLDTINGVIEGKTVTVKATPKTGYIFQQWLVAYDNQTPIGTDVSLANANAATTTFVMPATSKDITVTAVFERDSAYASSECIIDDVALYAASDTSMSTPLGTVDLVGNVFTISLPYGTDTADLGQMILKIDHSADATVTKTGDGEPKDWAVGQPCGVALNTPATFTVLAEDGVHSATYTVTVTKAARSDKDITAVELCEFGGTPVIVSGVVSGADITVTLPGDTSQSVLDQIGMKCLKITHSAGSTVAQSGGYGDADGTFKWANGDVMCNMSLNTPCTFTVTAEDASTKNYTITIVYTVPGAPALSAGSATRTSDTAASVTFTSSEAGKYYYAVVNSGAAAPTVDTTGSGTTAAEGQNTISLSNLTAGARDIYIVVKNAAGTATSAPLKVAIPAFTSSEGAYTITVAAPAGGTITPSKARADAGETITVTVTPNSGYQMQADSLTYTLAAAGGETVKVTNYTFTMPSGNVSLTCKWETAVVAVDGITGFSIDGVVGKVNNTTNTITITMPYGTDVKHLIPTISGNSIVSISPDPDTAADFTDPVIYTVTLNDGSVKTYTATVYVLAGSPSQQMWDKLTDFYNQTPWWEWAEHQTSKGRYPTYW